MWIKVGVSERPELEMYEHRTCKNYYNARYERWRLSVGSFCASPVTCPREPISFVHLLYACSGCSSFRAICEYCVCDILCAFRVRLWLLVGNQHQKNNCIKSCYVNVTGAESYTGKPERWCIKYTVTWSVKQAPACQSTTLPKHKNYCWSMRNKQ
jgi:hypothetical protein